MAEEMKHEGEWVWITKRKPSEPRFDWQSREPVTEEMKALICTAWELYDGSDVTYDSITHEESVLAHYAAGLKAQVEELKKALMEAPPDALWVRDENGERKLYRYIGPTIQELREQKAKGVEPNAEV